MVKRESDEGHQVCTHSWDHASGSGQGSLSFMSRDEQRDEIVRGMQAIADATGKDASKSHTRPRRKLSS
ncbi:MAG: polysaccharide deacetylase family protein [Eggerthellaceae bacterium]